MAMQASADLFKRQAAEYAARFLHDGMRLGLGTGSTAAFFVDCVGALVAKGMRLTCVPTSERTRAQAEKLGVPLSTLERTPELDLTVDGADEIDPDLRLIKGGGGALLREKIVAGASKTMLVISDASKLVPQLGRFKLPVEVDPFGLAATQRHIEQAAQACGSPGPAILRRTAEGNAFVTDGGHFIFDCDLKSLVAPDALAAALNAIPGVVEHGLFIGMARGVIIADADGPRLIGNASHFERLAMS